MKKKLLALMIAIVLMLGAIIPINAGPTDHLPLRPIAPLRYPLLSAAATYQPVIM